MKRVTPRTNRCVSALLWCLLVFLIVVGLACRKKPATPEPSGPEPQAASVPQPAATTEALPEEVAETPAEPEPVVVTVNGEEITEGQLEERLDYRMKSSAQLANLPPAFVAQVKSQLRTRVLDDLIAQCLLEQQLETTHVEVADAEVLAAIERRGAAENPPITVEQFKEIVASQGGDFDRVKEQFRTGIALDKFMEGKLTGKTDVTDDEAKQYYDENPPDFEVPEQVQASHILIGFPTSADPNIDPNEAKAAAKVTAKAKAEELLQQIKDGGDFAVLAQANSIDTGSAARGGDLGFFSRGKMVAPFEEAAFALEPDQVSDVVETQFGYHIIKATGHKDARTVPFSEARAGVLGKLTSQKRTQLIREYIQSLKDQATIVYPPGSAPVMSEPVPMGPVSAPSAPDAETPAAPTPMEPATSADPNAG